MSNVVVRFRDGTFKEFKETGYRGYTNVVTCGGGVVTISDEFGAKVTYPLDLVKEIEQAAPPGGR